MKQLKEDIYNNLVINKIKLYMCDKGYSSFGIMRVASSLEYYKQDLQWRMDWLGAPSQEHLCKSIVMENTAFDQNSYTPHFYEKYYCVVIQYTTKINSDKLGKLGRDIQNKHCVNKLGKKQFHFRLVAADVSYNLTGYRHNAVTPFALTHPMPLIISQPIITLQPNYFYLGGGAIDLKISNH